MISHSLSNVNRAFITLHMLVMRDCVHSFTHVGGTDTKHFVVTQLIENDLLGVL